MDTLAIQSHSSQSAAIAIGNNTFKGDEFPMFESKVINYFKTHNIYHTLETAQKGPASRMSIGGTTIKIDTDDENEIVMIEKEFEFPPDNEEEKDEISREKRNVAIEKYNILVVKTNAIRARKKAGSTKLVNVCFAAYTYIFTALTMDTAKLFLYITAGNVYALWEAIKNKYKGVTLVDQNHIRDMMNTVHLGINDDIDVYVSKINHYQLQLLELNAGMTQHDLIYRLYKGLPSSYDAFVEILQQTEKMTKQSLTFDEIVTNLRENQIKQRNKLSHTQAHIAYEQAFSITNNTQHTHNNTTQQTKIQKTPVKRRVYICFRCGGEHKNHACKIEKESVTCETCKKIGHIASQHDRFVEFKKRFENAFCCAEVAVSIPNNNNSVVVIDTLGGNNDVNTDLLRDINTPKISDEALLITDINAHVLDSGATNHFVVNENQLENIRSIKPIYLRTAGSNILTGDKSGTIRIYTNDGTHNFITFDDAICVPGLTTNLLSVSQLTSNGCDVNFGQKEATITKRNGQKLKIPIKGKLYIIICFFYNCCCKK